MCVESIENIIKKYISELHNSNFMIERIILFGSYNNGNYTKDSDIDLIVISPVFDGNYTREDIVKLWRIAAKVDTRIEPIACGVKQWHTDDSNVILEVARREGISIHAA